MYALTVPILNHHNPNNTNADLNPDPMCENAHKVWCKSREEQAWQPVGLRFLST